MWSDSVFERTSSMDTTSSQNSSSDSLESEDSRGERSNPEAVVIEEKYHSMYQLCQYRARTCRISSRTPPNFGGSLPPDANKYLEPHLYPIEPVQSSDVSMDLFREHCRMAQDYVDVRRNIAQLEQYRSQLESALATDQPDPFYPGPPSGCPFMTPEDQDCADEVRQLEQENASLLEFYRELQRHLDFSRDVPPGQFVTDDGWVVVPRAAT